MKSSHTARKGVLLASIEQTLSVIEKSDLPELKPESALFCQWENTPGAIKVGWGWMKTAINDEIISTKDMSDCSAIVVCTNFDERTGIFRERSLMHVLGSCFYGSDAVMQSLDLLRRATDSLGRPRCIIALGAHVERSDFDTIEDQGITMKDGRICKPFKELQRLCDTTIVAQNSGIAVRPDGRYVLLPKLAHSHHG